MKNRRKPASPLATQMRFRSQQEVSYAGQMLSAMRRAFGLEQPPRVIDAHVLDLAFALRELRVKSMQLSRPLRQHLEAADQGKGIARREV